MSWEPTLGAQDEDPRQGVDPRLALYWCGGGGGGAQVFPALWGHSRFKVRQALHGASFPCPALALPAKQSSLLPIPQHPLCAYTHTHTHRHTQHTGRKCYSRKPNPLDHPVCFRQNPLHAGWWCHKFHSSKILHIKGEQWWKIHEISKQGQAPAGLSLPRWVTQARGLWHRVLELQGLVVLGFSENALSLVRCFHAAWEPVLVCLGGQRSSRNSHPPPEHQGRAHSRAEAKTHPEVSQDSNKEGSGRGKFLTFRHSQLAKVEWKNHYWMYFLCHSEERF